MRAQARTSERGTVTVLTVIAGLVAWQAATGAAHLVLAQTTAPDILPSLVSGGGTLGATAGLVYIGRMMLSGRLVSRDVAAVEQRAAEREHALEEALGETRKVVDRYSAVVDRALSERGGRRDYPDA